MTKTFKKLEKIAKKYKFAFLASGCSTIARQRGGGVCAPGANWGGGTRVVGDSAGGAMGGGQQWGFLQPLRTALHTINISLQNSLS